MNKYKNSISNTAHSTVMTQPSIHTKHIQYKLDLLTPTLIIITICYVSLYVRIANNTIPGVDYQVYLNCIVNAYSFDQNINLTYF